ncbi:MAG: hypothetical protein JO152_14665 [Mycobacteriaceae bacterium]|nr:hypothetical protein [Mycobacteriaceae bacterium]
MGRRVAVVWHALFSIAAGALYFFFVLPRWPELSYQTSHTLGTVLRIVCGALIGLAGLPVVFMWLRTRKPEFGTPQMALTLRLSSVVFHVLGGLLIIGTAISEIWLTLDSAGRWLFGIYGAAAAISILGIFAFYLAFLAELPPPPPRPLKSKKSKRRGRKAKSDETAETDEDSAETDKTPADETPDGAEDTAEEAETEEAPAEEKPAEVVAEDDKPADQPSADDTPTSKDDTPTADDDTPADNDDTTDKPRRGLRNRRPASRRRQRSRGGVAVED